MSNLPRELERMGVRVSALRNAKGFVVLAHEGVRPKNLALQVVARVERSVPSDVFCRSVSDQDNLHRLPEYSSSVEMVLILHP